MRRHKVWPALALGLALLFSQTLGLLHGVVHPSAGPKGEQGQAAVRSVIGASSEAGRFVASLVSKHDDTRRCEALDRLALGSTLESDPGAAIGIPSASGLEPRIGRLPALAEACKHDFQARAPPIAQWFQPQSC